MRVLIVEDNLDIQANIAEYLEDQYSLDFAYSGHQGLKLALDNDYDVIILDLMLPGIDGIEICRTLRQEAAFQTPVLMLTARDTLDDKEIGFSAGADDYLVKPFSLRELKMRIDALAKRPKAKNTQTLIYEDLTLSMATLELVTVSKTSTTLNKKEAIILNMLIDAAPNVVTSGALSYRLWGEDIPESGALRTHIYNLRQVFKKLETCCEVKTIRANGYSLTSTEHT
jgi:DNA-binding response OmpR family regulator